MPESNNDNELIYYICEIQDITEQTEIQSKLNKKENLYSAIIKNFPSGLIVVFDHDLRYESVNGDSLAKIGMSKELMEGKTIWEVFPKEIADSVEAVYKDTLAGESFKRIRYYGEFVFLSHFFPVRDENNQVICGVNMAQDITDIKHKEQELQNSHNDLNKIKEELENEVIKRTKELNTEKDKLSSVFNNAPAVVALLEGPEHRFVISNPFHQKLYSDRKIVGKPIREALPELQGQGIYELFDKVYNTGIPFITNEHLALLDTNNNGILKPFYFNFVYQPIFNITNKVEGICIFAFDVTEQVTARKETEKLNLDLIERSNQLNSINKELEAFSYSVSHDLRSPLRAIDGFSQALVENYSDKIDDKGKDFLNRIRAATQRMGNLIDDLLKLSNLSKSEMKIEIVDLTKIARENIENLEIIFKHQVNINIQDNLSVKGDKQLLSIVLDNLFNNAFKFTGKTPDASIEFGSIIENNKVVYFVKDNGAGFNMDYSKLLFGAFQRLHRVAEFPGTGIGLATVKRVIHKHGGEIWANSQVNQGAVFYFTLPNT